MGDRILVTGGAGFIGSHLTSKLLDQGNSVLCYDNFNNYYPASIKKQNIFEFRKNKHYSLVKGDVRNSNELLAAFTTFEPDYVIHLAALPGVRASYNNSRIYKEVNIGGTINVLRASKATDVKKVVQASSSSVYGNDSREASSEEKSKIKPISPYAETKAKAESECYAFSELHNLDITSLRFFSVYGPKQRPDMAISKFTKLMLENSPIKIYGDGKIIRDFTYVADIVNGICLTLKSDLKKHNSINLGSNEPTSILDLVSMLSNILNMNPTLVFQGMKLGDAVRTNSDNTKAKRLIGYNPTTNLRLGLNQYISSLNLASISSAS